MEAGTGDGVRAPPPRPAWGSGSGPPPARPLGRGEGGGSLPPRRALPTATPSFPPLALDIFVKSSAPPPPSLWTLSLNSFSLTRPLSGVFCCVPQCPCEQADCLAKIERHTFSSTTCPSLSEELFALRTNATLARYCPGYFKVQEFYF
ncbi:thymic stromal lymphopoietin isoform X2 [Fukomys damarensis]|uniref:thymic stromal lymphopoietin isoform X2 n=1 Tax=Fukomys damarensis TaxID=885580 RepID=UPI001455AE35|nr:thymic stromal lymphopoietin isoform X2 [Fukomys damarensis]